MKEENRIPERRYNPQSLNFTMNEIIHIDHRGYLDCQLFKGEYLFRFKIPDFQRPIVWDNNQCIKFIESAWLGYDIGSYLVNKVQNWVKLKNDDSGKEYIHPYDDYLLDGQQRINAIKRYIACDFKVFGLLYCELTEIEKRRFENTTFTQNRVFLTDITELKELYNRLNFGGTAHTEDQRA